MKIVVLMSTYNGENFIKEQIDSILRQDVTKTVDLELLIRDDGSKDGTHAILDEYQAKGALTWYTGENLRPAKSFWNLVEHAPESDYYAFCDQDDVWFSDKLSRAIRKIEEKSETDKPILYCSAVTVTDARLNPIGKLSASYQAENDFAYSLMYSISPGCTFVFNAAARNEMLRYNMNEQFELIHDWMAHKIVALKGTVIHDSEPSMYYRQHGNNVIGSQRSGFLGMLDRARHFLKDRSCVRSQVAQSLMNVYGADLCEESKEYRYLNIVANYRNNSKLRKAFHKESAFKTGTKQDFFLFCLISIRKI